MLKKEDYISLAFEYADMPEGIRTRLSLANVFFSRNYVNYAKEAGFKIIYAYNDEYVLPISVYKKICFSYAVFMSECYSYKCNDNEESRKQFLNHVINKLKKSMGIAWVSTGATAFFDVFPSDSERIPFGSHVADLTLSEEELWKNIHSKHRNSIRRAEKNNVYIVTGKEELIDDYLSLDEETWARSNKRTYGKNFFEKIVTGMNDAVVIALAYKDAKPQAGGIFYKNSQMSYYMYGTSANHPEPGSANLLQWETMKMFKMEGVKKYSFVGCRINEDADSKYHGIQRFKERFGGDLIQGYMFRSILHPAKRKLFQLLYRLKNGSKLQDIIDSEIHKWPELNKSC